MTDAGETGTGPAARPSRWLSALPDAAAFVAGLAMAWLLGWKARPPAAGVPFAARAALAGVRMFGGLFLLAFFTFHFGFFHLIHPVFLNSFFPVFAGGHSRGFSPVALYLRVLHDYWPFVLVAAVAEHGAFRARPSASRRGGGFMDAYVNVLRMHGLIFFFAFAHFAKI